MLLWTSWWAESNRTGMGPSGAARGYKKMRQWLRLLDLVAAPPDPDGAERCRLCGKEGVRLCKGCNNSAPSASIGRDLEGFLLATWCMVQMGGEAWMRSTMLNKARWRR